MSQIITLLHVVLPTAAFEILV